MAIMQKATGQQAGAPPPQVQGASGGAMPPEASGAPPAGSMEGAGYDDEGLPDEQQDAQLAAFIDNAYVIIYGGSSPDGQISPEVAESLRAGQSADPEAGASGAIEALAGTAATIGARVAASAMEAGQQLDGPGVVLPGTFSLVEDLADVAVKEGIYDYAEEELASAVTLSGERLFEKTQELGLWNEQEFDAAVQEAIQLNQSGELEQMMPETSAAMGTIAGGGGGGGAGGGAPAPAAPPPMP